MKNQVAQIARVTAEANNEIFFDEQLSPISSVDLKGIRDLRCFLPVIVLIPRPLAPDSSRSTKNFAGEVCGPRLRDDKAAWSSGKSGGALQK
jgi:hypothetical protein